MYFDLARDTHSVFYELSNKKLNWIWYVNQPEPELKVNTNSFLSFFFLSIRMFFMSFFLYDLTISEQLCYAKSKPRNDQQDASRSRHHLDPRASETHERN